MSSNDATGYLLPLQHLAIAVSLPQLSGRLHSTTACKSSALASHLPFNRQTTAHSSFSGNYFLIAAHFTQPIFTDSKRRNHIPGLVKPFRSTGAKNSHATRIPFLPTFNLNPSASLVSSLGREHGFCIEHLHISLFSTFG